MPMTPKEICVGIVGADHARLSTTARYTQVATHLIADTLSPLDRLSLAVTPPS
jgi:hypothetical protein